MVFLYYFCECSALYVDISIARIERKNSKHILASSLISQSPPAHGADLGRKLHMDAVDRADKALADVSLCVKRYA